MTTTKKVQAKPVSLWVATISDTKYTLRGIGATRAEALVNCAKALRAHAKDYGFSIAEFPQDEWRVERLTAGQAYYGDTVISGPPCEEV